MEAVEGLEAGERGKAEGAETPRAFWRRGVQIPAQDAATQPAGQHLQFELPLEHLVDVAGLAVFDESLDRGERHDVRPVQAAEAEPVHVPIAPVHGEGGDALRRRRQPGAGPPNHPGAQCGHVPGHDSVGLEEQGGPADPRHRRRPRVRDGGEPQHPIDGKQRQFPSDLRDVGDGGPRPAHGCQVYRRRHAWPWRRRGGGTCPEWSIFGARRGMPFPADHPAFGPGGSGGENAGKSVKSPLRPPPANDCIRPRRGCEDGDWIG